MHFKPMTLVVLFCLMGLFAGGQSAAYAGQMYLGDRPKGVYSIPLLLSTQWGKEQLPGDVRVEVDRNKSHVQVIRSDTDRLSLDMRVDNIAWNQDGVVALAGEGKIQFVGYNKEIKKLREYAIPDVHVEFMELHGVGLVGLGSSKIARQAAFRADVYDEFLLVRHGPGERRHVQNVINYRDGLLLINPAFPQTPITHQRWGSLFTNEPASLDRQLGKPTIAFTVDDRLIVLTEKLAIIECTAEKPIHGHGHFLITQRRRVEPQLRFSERMWLVETVGNKAYIRVEKRIESKGNNPFIFDIELTLIEIDFDKLTLRSMPVKLEERENGWFVWDTRGLHLVSDNKTKLLLEREKFEATEAKPFKWSNVQTSAQ